MSSNGSVEAVSDMERYARRTHAPSVTAQVTSPYERRVRWAFPGASGHNRAVRLQHGVELNLTRLEWEHPWTFRFADAPTALKFQLARGSQLRMTPDLSDAYTFGGNHFQVKHTSSSSAVTCDFIGHNAQCEHLSLEIAPERLRELCGAPLPPALERIVSGNHTRARYEQPMNPALGRLLDDVWYSDGRGASGHLYLQGKCLELLSVFVDELQAASEAALPFGRRDMDRFAHATQVLVARIEQPPTLRELARQVGLNELKLKQGFRSLYGTTVYGYLRSHRMELAWRLLTRGQLSVTEVALRVGYANPSKFSAAFRRRFGCAPSALRA